MKVSIALLTYNRLDMLRLTLSSIVSEDYPHKLHILDGGSTDGSREFVRGMDGFCGGPGTVGALMNQVIESALQDDPDLVVFSADDYVYRNNWLAYLVNFWKAAPPEIVIASANWEPSYPWNAVTASPSIGGLSVLIRDSVPGSSWTFRASEWPLIGPLADKTGGEDLEVCKRLTDSGRKLAALNLSEHIGEKHSAWGNESWRIAKPLAIKDM